MMPVSPLRDAASLTSLDAFLDQEGTRDAFQALAIKEVLAWQIRQAMEAQHLSQKKLAEKMGTSRSQISRLLDPSDGNVTLATLQRAAEMLGRKVRLELILRLATCCFVRPRWTVSPLTSARRIA